uniref:Uncharacterized protein n=2 Tax=Aplanochytrium stocchinoi TaxID=215587 RepID=A0A7S3PBL8_9STRA
MLEDAKRLKTLNEIRNLGFELSPEIIEDLKPFADRVTNLRAVSDPNQLSHLVEDLSIFLLNYDLKSVAQVLRHLLKEEFDPDFVQRNPEFFYLTCGVWLVLASVLPETDPIWVPSILDSASKERRAAHIGAFYGQVLNAGMYVYITFSQPVQNNPGHDDLVHILRILYTHIDRIVSIIKT